MSVQREWGSSGCGCVERSRAGPYSAADPCGTNTSDSPLCLIRFLCVRERHYDYLCEQRARGAEEPLCSWPPGHVLTYNKFEIYKNNHHQSQVLHFINIRKYYVFCNIAFLVLIFISYVNTQMVCVNLHIGNWILILRWDTAGEWRININAYISILHFYCRLMT